MQACLRGVAWKDSDSMGFVVKEATEKVFGECPVRARAIPVSLPRGCIKRNGGASRGTRAAAARFD